MALNFREIQRWGAGFMAAVFVTVSGSPAPVLAQPSAVPAAAAPAADAIVNKTASLLSSYGTNENFTKAMEALDPGQRQKVIDLLIVQKPFALVGYVFGAAPRYQEEFYRSLPRNPEFIFKLLEVSDSPVPRGRLIEAMGSPLFEEGLQKKAVVGRALTKIMNDLHDSPDAVRFEKVSSLKSGALYDVIVQGREDVYTSTFNGLYNRFVQRMRAEGKSFFDIIDAYPERQFGLPVFLDAVSTFERTGDFWARLSPAEQTRLIDHIFNDVNKYSDPIHAYAAAEFIRSLPGNNPSHALIEQKIREGFESQTGDKKDVYGVLARWYIETSPHQVSAQNQAFFSKISADPRYALERPASIGGADLFDAQGRNFQIHMFFDDDDGRTAYAGFMNRMRGDGWSVRDINSGIAVVKKTTGTRTITAYVSKPAVDGRVTKEIRALIAAEGGVATVMVQRGHSYHVAKAVASIDKDIKFAFFGACGTSMVMSDLASMFPQMQVAGSAGTGRGAINNASIILMNNALLRSGEVSWDAMNRSWSGINGGNEYFTPGDSAAQVFVKTMQKIKARAPALAFHDSFTLDYAA